MEPAVNCYLLKYVALWGCFSEYGVSSSTRWIKILSGIWKHARNSCSDKTSTGRSDLRCLTLVSFRPLFQGLPLPLVKAAPSLADMLSSSGLHGSLCGITQLLELVTQPIHHLTMPQLCNKKPRQNKSLSLNKSTNNAHKASLLTNN